MIPDKVQRLLSLISYFMVFASATIVTGILGRFLHITSAYNTHVVFQETVAAATVPLYLGHIVFPQIDSYREHTMLVSLVFSYLWLTSFIFAAEDWTGGRCAQAFPVESSCSQKQTVVAFDFLVFFFLFTDMIMKGLSLYTKSKAHSQEKRVHNNGVMSTNLDNASRA